MPNETARFKQLLAKNELEELLKALLAFTDNSTWRHLNDKTLSCSARYHELQDKNQLHIISEADYQLGISQLRHALLEIINALSNEKTTPTLPSKRPIWKIWWAAIPVIIGVLAGIVQIVDYFTPDTTEQSQPSTVDTSATKDNIATDTTTKTTLDTLTTKTTPDTQNPKSNPQNSPPITQNSKSNPQNSTLDTLSIQLFSNKKGNPVRFKAGETMRYYVQVTRPCYVRCIYELATGDLVLFENDLKIESHQVNQPIEIGEGFEVAAPFGKEAVYVFAQSQPFPKLTLRHENGYDFIVEGLPKALEKTRGFKKKIAFAEATLAVETLE